MSLSFRPTQSILCRHVLVVALIPLVAATLPAQNKPNKSERKEMKREGNSVALVGKPAPEDPQSRMLGKLREQLEIPDDEEWEVIGARITKVGELRRTISAGASLSDKGKRSAKSAHPEQDALRLAVANKLPDAEIKTRLARAHEIYRDNESRLARAQDELRAVLTVRQEAVMVMAGILPP